MHTYVYTIYHICLYLSYNHDPKRHICLYLSYNHTPKTHKHIRMERMEWLRLVGSSKLQVSFAEYSLFNRALLQKRPNHTPKTHKHIRMERMEWLRLVGSSKLQVSFAEYSLFHRALLQKRPIILRSLLIVATPYERCTHRMP